MLEERLADLSSTPAKITTEFGEHYRALRRRSPTRIKNWALRSFSLEAADLAANFRGRPTLQKKPPSTLL
ncbi:MAG: hypothetical protein ABJG42_16620, partial [Vibrio splendidus]